MLTFGYLNSYMLRKLFFLLIIALSSSFLYAQRTFPHPGITDKKEVYTLFKNAVVHQSPQRTDTVNVLIYKDKIIAVGSANELTIPKNTVVKELAGFEIFPSFIELNSDYGITLPEKKEEERGPEYKRAENKAVAWNAALHPERKAIRLFEPNAAEADTLRSMGFGVVLSQIRDGIIRGTSVVVTTGGGTANSNVLISNAAMHYSFDKGRSIQDYPSSLMGAIALLRQTFYNLEWYKNSGESSANYGLESLEKSKSLPAFFEANEKYAIRRLAKIANEFDKKFVVIGAGDTYQLQEPDFAGLEALVVPLKFPKPYDMSDPDLSRFVSQQSLLEWEWAPFNPRYIHELGIGFALSGNGISKPQTFFSNLRKCVAKGLQKDSALAALTTFPAKILGIEKEVGKIEPGFQANFFIATANVFTDPNATITQHWINGERYPVAALKATPLEAVYTLNVDDNYYILEVEGEKDYRAKVLEIKGADTTAFDAKLTQQSRQVVLQFRTDTTGGFYRLGATILSDNRIWDGSGYSPEGEKVKWNAIRRRAKPKTNETRSDTATRSLPTFPNRYFPFQAYGFDSLPKPQTILFTHARIWTNDSLGIIEDGQMLIQNGKIRAVGKTVNTDEFIKRKKRDKLRIIDLSGKNLTPGIIDEHSHIAVTGGVNEGTHASSAEVRISDVLNPDDIDIYRQLAGGVTTAQILHGSANPIGGQSAIIKLRWGAGFDDLLFEAAPPFIKFALGENVKQSNWGADYDSRYPQTRMGVEQFFYDNFYRARTYGQDKRIAAARKKHEKKKRRRRKEETKHAPFRTDLQLEALLEILIGKRYITCHSYVQSEIIMLLNVADSMGFDVNTFTHGLEAYKVADKIKAHGAAVSTFSDWWAYKYEVKDAIPFNAAILNAEGVLVAINSDDAEMGRRLNQEAAKTIKYGGVSEEEALKMITLNPARMLHIDQYVGSISPGKDADFVIWSGHPLSVYSKAEQTYIDGIKYFDRSADAVRQKRLQRERARITRLMREAVEAGAQAKKPQRKIERNYTCESEN